jgi:hypothetical protein
MKKLTFYALIVVVAISTVAFVNTKNTTVENEKADDYFLEFLEESKSYTIERAEAMPADK